jgi:hypothetical protein
MLQNGVTKRRARFGEYKISVRQPTLHAAPHRRSSMM